MRLIRKHVRLAQQPRDKKDEIGSGGHVIGQSPRREQKAFPGSRWLT